MGRRKQNYLPLSEASHWAQMEQLQSRSQYQTWWDIHKPIQMPRAPWRVYDDWNGWPNFLGNDNEFANANPHEYRSFDQALVYAHASGIKTAQEWFAYGKHPDDIPVRPEVVYRGYFLGWKSWLGTGKLGLAHKVKVAQIVRDPGVLVLGVAHGNPGNVIHGFVGPGRDEVLAKANRDHMRILKMFKMEEGYNWKDLMGKHGSLYGEDEWIVANVNELVWEYSNDLMFIN